MSAGFKYYSSSAKVFVPTDTLRYCFSSSPLNDTFTVDSIANTLTKKLKTLVGGTSSSSSVAIESQEDKKDVGGKEERKGKESSEEEEDKVIDESAFFVVDNILLESCATFEASFRTIRGRHNYDLLYNLLVRMENLKFLFRCCSNEVFFFSKYN